MVAAQEADHAFPVGLVHPSDFALPVGGRLRLLLCTQPGWCQISIVSMVRRGSVVVSFLFGAMVFREKNLQSKAVDLVLVLLGMVFLYLGSR